MLIPSTRFDGGGRAGRQPMWWLDAKATLPPRTLGQNWPIAGRMDPAAAAEMRGDHTAASLPRRCGMPLRLRPKHHTPH